MSNRRARKRAAHVDGPFMFESGAKLRKGSLERSGQVIGAAGEHRDKRIRVHVFADERHAAIAERDVAAARMEAVDTLVVVAVHHLGERACRSDSSYLLSTPDGEDAVTAVGIDAAVCPLIVREAALPRLLQRCV